MKKKIVKRRGVGLVELLIALSISAILLTATAVAVDASFKAYASNQEQSNLIQQGRMALNRMVTSIRGTRAHGPTVAAQNAQFKAGMKVTTTGIDMIEDPYNDGSVMTDVVYRYDSVKKQIFTDITPMAPIAKPTKTYVLARGVEAFQITMEPMRSEENLRTGGAYDLLRRATILITINTAKDTAGVGESTGKHPVTLSLSISPRKNSW